MDKGNTFWGFITGLAVGAALGVLFAPAKGSETRQKISDKGNEIGDSLKKKFDEFIDGLADQSTKVNDGTTEKP